MGRRRPWREQVEAGLLKDITADIAVLDRTMVNPGAMSIYQYNGKQYGIPCDLGMVGFWYNKDLFAQAGITAPPATWDEFLADVDKLKAAGHHPVAVGGTGDLAEIFWWAYLALRECGGDVMTQATTTDDWTNPCFVEAGNKLKGLVDLEPFQEGFLAATWDGAGGLGRDGRGREGRHAADGPVGPGHDAGEHG